MARERRFGCEAGKASHGWDRGKVDEAGRVKQDQNHLTACIPPGPGMDQQICVSDQPCMVCCWPMFVLPQSTEPVDWHHPDGAYTSGAPLLQVYVVQTAVCLWYVLCVTRY